MKFPKKSNCNFQLSCSFCKLCDSAVVQLCSGAVSHQTWYEHQMSAAPHSPRGDGDPLSCSMLPGPDPGPLPIMCCLEILLFIMGAVLGTAANERQRSFHSAQRRIVFMAFLLLKVLSQLRHYFKDTMLTKPSSQIVGAFSFFLQLWCSASRLLYPVSGRSGLSILASCGIQDQGRGSALCIVLDCNHRSAESPARWP